MDGILSLKEIKELFQSEKKIKIIFIIGAIFILLIALSGLGGSKKEEAGDYLFNYDKQGRYEKSLESKLSDVLSKIEGIGNINIMITLESSEENIYSDNDNEPSSIKTPLVRGVIVVCDGGDNIIVKEKVINAVSGVFGISTTRVSVIK